jgi:hypothetical protein
MSNQEEVKDDKKYPPGKKLLKKNCGKRDYAFSQQISS